MSKKINSLKKCEDFLLKVVSEHPDQYQDINDLLQRYKNLQSSISMLEDRAQSIEEDYEKIKNEYSKIEKEKINEILLLNIEISSLQKKLEVMDSHKKEIIGEIENNIQSNFSENVIVARIFMAIDNLYFQCKEKSQ